MIGCFLAFMIYYALEEDGVNGDMITEILPFNLGVWLSEHPDMYVLFILMTALSIIACWPYVIYLMWRNDNEED